MTARGLLARLVRLGGQLWSTLALPLVAILLAVVAGAVVIIVTSWLVPGHPFDPGLPVTAYAALFEGSLGSANGRIETLVQAAPLLLAGLGIGLGFKGGLFNIGAQGQFLMGAVASVAAAGWIHSSNPWIAITVALLAGCAVGAAWGFVPGLLKAVSGAHEVVTTIMLNYVALAALSWLVAGPLRLPRSPQPITADVGAAALPVLMGRDGHLGIVIAFLAVPVIWFLLYRTTTGFEIRAVGANPDAARYAGMKPRRIVVLTMSLAGLLAGLAGSGNILGLNHQMTATFSTTVGFDAITVALLGQSNPIGIMLAAILFGAMRAGAALMQIKAGVPVELVDVVQSIILLFLVASVVFRRLFRLRGAKPALPSGESSLMATYGSEAEG
jgi:general nucleoside transport system permease protein